MHLKELIRGAWQNACHNGDECQLRAMTPYSLACDMYDCDSEIGKHPHDDVVVAVQEFVDAGFQ